MSINKFRRKKNKDDVDEKVKIKMFILNEGCWWVNIKNEKKKKVKERGNKVNHILIHWQQWLFVYYLGNDMLPKTKFYY